MRSIGPSEAADVSLRQILDGSLAFIGLIALDGTLLEANALALEAGGLTRDDVIGKKFWDCYWWSYDAAIQDQLQAAHKQALAGGVVRYDVQVRMADERLMWIDFQLAPMRDADGQVTHLIPSGLDLTARKQAEAAVINSEAKFRGVFENAFVGVAMVGLDGTWLEVNDRLCELLGYARQELLSKTFQDITYFEDLQSDLDQLTALRAGLIKNYKMDKRYIRKDGSIMWASLTVAMKTGADGEPLHFISIVSDITERVKAQQHQQLLMSELGHRLKNQLALVGAMANQSMRSVSDLEEFREKFSGRLRALATSADLLISQNRRDAPLRELLTQALAPFPGARDVGGDDVSIDGEMAETLALAVHELATNAMKYGAWSRPEGMVSLRWELAQSDDGAALVKISWIEQGGPPVSPPTRTGFGLKITDGLTAQKLNGTVRYEFPVDGVRWHLEMPL